MVSPARIRTNRLLAKAFNLNDFLDPTRLAHDELQYYNDLTRAFDKIISHHIDWLDSPEAKKLFYEDIQNREEYFNTIDSDLDDIIRDTSLSADRIIEKVYRKGLSHGYKDINRLPVFNDACKYGLKATQEYNFELIQSVSNDLIDSIRHHIFRGVAEGQSIHEVARAITDSGLQPLKNKTLSAYQRASLIARTEIARSMTTGRLQSYANYGVKKVKILTAGDDNVCPICRKAEKKIYTLEKAANLIPFHPACRCSVIAHIEHYKLPEKPIDNSNEIILTDQKSHNWTYDYKGKNYQVQGNTPRGRQEFLENYGIDLDELNKEENKNEKLFLQILTKDSSPINDFLRLENKNLNDFYLASIEWKKINDNLRDEGILTEDLSFDDALVIAEYIFDKYSVIVDKDIIVCRREKNRYMGKDDEVIYEDDGFTSTSIYEFAKEDEYGNELSYILIPKGTSILYLEGITSSKGDYEVLFPQKIHLNHIETLNNKKQVWGL